MLYVRVCLLCVCECVCVCVRARAFILVLCLLVCVCVCVCVHRLKKLIALPIDALLLQSEMDSACGECVGCRSHEGA